MSLQNISKNVSLTQNHLSTGLKINSAIDNPSSFYTARSLENRASDLNALLDSMSQATQTIKAATTALEASAVFLEQAAAIAAQVMETLSSNIVKITSDMTTDQIQALIKDNVEIHLVDDIILKETLKITAQNVKINGNGHKIIFEPSDTDQAAIMVEGGSLEVTSLGIESNTDKIYGIRVINTLNEDNSIARQGSLIIDNAENFNLAGIGSRDIVNGDPNIYDGKGNTAVMIAAHKGNTSDPLSNYSVFERVNSYSISNNEQFGAGKWYLGSIGELMQVNGFNSADVNGAGTSGATNANYQIIQDTLSKLAQTAEGTALGSGYYWSSTEFSTYYSWKLCFSDGVRQQYLNKNSGNAVRAFLLLENSFDPLSLPTEQQPNVGDIMYDDGSWGSKDDHVSGTKTVVGVITNVSKTGDITIMSLKDVGSVTSWGGYGKNASVPEYDSDNLTRAFMSEGIITINNVITSSDERLEVSEQYNNIIAQYDSLMKDGSYKGVNLLNNESLNITFNEDNSSSLNIVGKDMSSGNLGITKAEWICQSDVADSLRQIADALSSIRSFQTELGNNFSIISTRQNFTENLINVLTEGADKLTLADMNEESANMLALQTRQQLATNALSLANQANQSIFKLF